MKRYGLIVMGVALAVIATLAWVMMLVGTDPLAYTESVPDGSGQFMVVTYNLGCWIAYAVALVGFGVALWGLVRNRRRFLYHN